MKNSHSRADQRLREQVQHRIERDRLQSIPAGCRAPCGPAGSAPTPGRSATTSMPCSAQMLGRADARQHQEFRRIDRRRGDDHFTSRLNDLNLFVSFDLDADGALILDDHAPREAFDQTDILPFQRRPQIGVGGRPAAAVADGLLHRPKAFLLGAVIVVGQSRSRPGGLPRRRRR